MSLRLLHSKVLFIRRTPNFRNYGRKTNPISKTLNVLGNDLPAITSSKNNSILYPEHTDVVIIGGGYIGSSVAYWLKTRAGDGLSVVVLEKDFTFKEAQKHQSLGILTQHFSLPENIHLSKYSIDFLRAAKENLNKDCDLQYNPTGSLVLASEKFADRLEENASILNELGVRNQILTSADIKKRYPWINVQDIKLGCMANEGEGTFNSWALLKGLIQKSTELGTNYVNAEVAGFEVEKQKDVLMEGVKPGTFERINKILYKTEDDVEHSLKFAICVLAAGHDSGYLTKLAGVGTGENILKVPLPIEKRTCNVYSIEDKATETGLCTPLIMDTTGLWLKGNGLENNLLCGNIPMMKDDAKDAMSDVEYFNNIVEPSLVNRFPNCKNAKILKYTTESYDCNTFDNSGILGPHPYHNNLYIAAGFGRYGCQQAPGVGRAIAELIIDSQYTTIDLTRLGFDRFLMNEAIVDFNVY